MDLLHNEYGSIRDGSVQKEGKLYVTSFKHEDLGFKVISNEEDESYQYYS